MKNCKGFTLIELIASLVIFSVLAAVLIPRYIDAETAAKYRAIDVGVSEINGRETLTWAMVKLSNTGYLNDGQVWTQLTTDPGTVLGPDYDWPSGPTIAGGVLRFKQEMSASLIRTGSNRETPARWRR